MANFTEQAIKATFLALLEERPLSQITIKDIVETCGINRNSFYYHYRDLPSLIEEIITDETKRIIREYPSIDSIEQCLEVVIQLALDRKKTIYHIYNSVARDIFEKYLWEVGEYAVTTYIDSIAGERGIRRDYREAIIRYYKCTLFGHVIDWLNHGMKTDIQSSFHLICELYKDAVLNAIHETPPANDS